MHLIVTGSLKADKVTDAITVYRYSVSPISLSSVTKNIDSVSFSKTGIYTSLILICPICFIYGFYAMVSNDDSVNKNRNMAREGCFALSVSGLLNDVTFQMAKCCAEVSDVAVNCKLY